MKKSGKILRMTAVLTAILVLLSSSLPALAASFKARINSSSAKVYAVPSTSSKYYVQGGRGITVTVTGYSGGWARIKYNGRTGYTQVKNLNLVNRPKAYTAKSTPVYRQDSSSSSRLGTLSAGSAVYVAGISGGYYRIQNESGSVTGYVKKGTLTTKTALMNAYNQYMAKKKAAAAASSSSSSSSSSKPASSATSKIDKVIALAASYVGRPYASSANPPSSFNCSAYVKYCMEKYGYDMKSDAASQCADSRYAEISLSKIQRGDILCFDTDDDGACDHTAIYIGSSKFLEASRINKQVQVNDLDDWYRDHFILARRPK